MLFVPLCGYRQSIYRLRPRHFLRANAATAARPVPIPVSLETKVTNRGEGTAYFYFFRVIVGGIYARIISKLSLGYYVFVTIDHLMSTC